MGADCRSFQHRCPQLPEWSHHAGLEQPYDGVTALLGVCNCDTENPPLENSPLPFPVPGRTEEKSSACWMHLLRWDSDAWAASEMCLSEVGTTGVKERGAGALLHGVSLHQHPRTGPGVVLKADSLAGVRQTNLTHSGEVLLSSAQGAPWTFHRSSTPGSSGVFLLHTNNRI